jgi:SAM-dependent methyltransferase
MDENASYQYAEDVNWGLLRLWGKREGLRILDVGCGFATTSQYLQKLGNDVTGVEESAEASTVAEQRIARVIRADLLVAEPDGLYDAIIFADVLEHVAWPVGVLRRYLQWLAPGGSVIISLPNVGLWSVRFAHLFGRWEYAETGVLDRTHLRFFTRRSARWLIDEAGLSPVRTAYNPGLVRPLVPFAKKLLAKRSASADAPPPPADALLKSRPYQIYLKTVYPLERAVTALWPGMLAFQMLFEAKLPQDRSTR